MTDKPTPTDAELKAMWQIHAADIGGIFDYARAVLAKWGTPAPVGVGEVAERYRNAIASACEGWTMPDGLRKHLETALWSQPTTSPQAAESVPAPAPPPECETEAEKRAFAFGWFKALESERMKADNKKKDPL